MTKGHSIMWTWLCMDAGAWLTWAEEPLLWTRLQCQAARLHSDPKQTGPQSGQRTAVRTAQMNLQSSVMDNATEREFNRCTDNHTSLSCFLQFFTKVTNMFICFHCGFLLQRHILHRPMLQYTCIIAQQLPWLHVNHSCPSVCLTLSLSLRSPVRSWGSLLVSSRWRCTRCPVRYPPEELPLPHPWSHPRSGLPGWPETSRTSPSAPPSPAGTHQCQTPLCENTARKRWK